MGAEDEVDIPAKLRQKLGEIVNKNLDRKNEKRVALLAEFYELCVTQGGQVFLRERADWRQRIWQKLVEFEPVQAARANAEYVAAAERLKNVISGLQPTGRRQE
jgi:hypothetical protein